MGFLQFQLNPTDLDFVYSEVLRLSHQGIWNSEMTRWYENFIVFKIAETVKNNINDVSRRLGEKFKWRAKDESTTIDQFNLIVPLEDDFSELIEINPKMAELLDQVRGFGIYTDIADELLILTYQRSKELNLNVNEFLVNNLIITHLPYLIDTIITYKDWNFLVMFLTAGDNSKDDIYDILLDYPNLQIPDFYKNQIITILPEVEFPY